MSRLPARLLVLLGLLPAALPSGAAAQRLEQGMSPRDVQRGVTVETRERPDYDPLGVRLGSFRLNGQAEAGPGFDSNVFGTRSRTVKDGFADTAAQLSLQSDWTRHAVGISGNMGSRQYFSRNDLDWTDWDLGGFGRYDVNADTNVQGAYRHTRAHLDVFNFDVQTAGIGRPVVYNSDEVSGTASTRFNRLGLLGTAIYRTYRFEDQVVGGAPSRISINDFDTVIGAVGANWLLAPGRYVTAIVRVQDISYQKADARFRDSFTWEGLVGLQYDFDGVWQGRVAVGWRRRDYQGGTLRPLEGPALEGELSWSPTLLTTVRLNVSRTIEESIRQDAVSFQRLQGGIRVDHEYLRNVILTAEARIDRREYDRPSQTASDAVFGLAARWLLNRNLQVLAAYSFASRLEATNGIQEYDRHLISLRLRVAL